MYINKYKIKTKTIGTFYKQIVVCVYERKFLFYIKKHSACFENKNGVEIYSVFYTSGYESAMNQFSEIVEKLMNGELAYKYGCFGG